MADQWGSVEDEVETQIDNFANHRVRAKETSRSPDLGPATGKLVGAVLSTPSVPRRGAVYRDSPLLALAREDPDATLPYDPQTGGYVTLASERGTCERPPGHNVSLAIERGTSEQSYVDAMLMLGGLEAQQVQARLPVRKDGDTMLSCAEVRVSPEVSVETCAMLPATVAMDRGNPDRLSANTEVVFSSRMARPVSRSSPLEQLETPSASQSVQDRLSRDVAFAIPGSGLRVGQRPPVGESTPAGANSLVTAAGRDEPIPSEVDRGQQIIELLNSLSGRIGEIERRVSGRRLTPLTSPIRDSRARSRSRGRQQGPSLRSAATVGRGSADAPPRSSSREDGYQYGSTAHPREADRPQPRSVDRAGRDSDDDDPRAVGGIGRRRRSRSRPTHGERLSAVADDGTVDRTSHGQPPQQSTVYDASTRAERSQRRSASAGRDRQITAVAGDRPATTLKDDSVDGGSSRHSSSDADGSSPGRGGASGHRPPNHNGDGPGSAKPDGRRRRQRSASGSRSRTPSRHKKKNWIKPDRFDGSSCVDTFLVKFEEAAAYNGWGVDDKLAHLYCSLTGPAEDLLFSTKGISYAELKERLRQRYGTREQQEKFRLELKFKRKKSAESLQELAGAVEKLTRLAYPTADVSTRDVLARDGFIDALDDRQLQIDIRRQNPASLDAALTLAMKLDVLNRGPVRDTDASRPRYLRAVATDAEEPASSGANSRASSTAPEPEQRSSNRRTLRGSGNGGSGKPGGQGSPLQQKRPPASAATSSPPLEQMMRKMMQEMTTSMMKGFQLKLDDFERRVNSQSSMPAASTPPSHVYVSRPSTTTTGTTPATSWDQSQQRRPQGYNDGTDKRGQYFCFECGEAGHFKRNCPMSNRFDNQRAARPAAAGETSAYRRETDTRFQNRGVPGKQLAAERVYLKLTILGRSRLCLLDSGSEVTLIPADFIGRRKVQGTHRRISAANGTEIPVKGWVSLPAYIDGVRVEVSGLVTDHVADVYLGHDWLQQNRVHWDFGNGEITLYGRRHRLVAKKSRDSWCRRVVAETDVVIPARSQFNLSTLAVYNRLPQRKEEESQAWATEPREVKDGLFVAGTLLPEDRATHLPVRVLNATDRPVVIHKGTTVSSVSAVSTGPVDPLGTSAAEPPSSDEVIDEMVSKVDPSISQSIREKLRQLLKRYSSVISLHELDLGWTDLVTHTIDTGDARPIRQQLRRHPPAH